MSMLSRLTQRTADAVEAAQFLDRPAAALVGVVSALGPGRIKDVLSGVAVGHPLHPALVTVPVGCVVGTTYLDAVGGDPASTRRLAGLAVLSSVPAVASGLSDWSETDGAERRVGLVHLTVNATGLALVGASWVARSGSRRSTTAVVLSGAGLALLGAGGWLGGHLAYALGVGVDTTAFLRPPVEWTDAVAETDLLEGRPVCATVDRTPVLLVRQDGRILAIGDRCTHRGGPLHEGPVVDGCVECPWHGSRFALSDGSVTRGPATVAAATFETRVRDGRVEVRRQEQRALRRNVVG